MKFFNKLDPNVIKFLKIGGLVLGLVIIVPLLLSIVSLMLERLSYDTTSQDLSYGTEESISQTSSKYYGGSESTGDTAEEFEITEYSVSFKVSNLDSMRDNISALKSRDDVIFESANEYKKSGYYVFKIKNDSVDEVLAIIEELDPTTISKSIYTIKSLVDSYVNEIEILESKLSAIEEALNDAISAYDNITEIAIAAQDVESLTKIIDSKVALIKDLSQERINIGAQIDRLEMSKAEQLDRLNYIYFSISVVEDKLINAQDLKDSWRVVIKSFIDDINGVIQGVTINLIAFLFIVLQCAVYLFVILVVAKYGWQLTKYFWKK